MSIDNHKNVNSDNNDDDILEYFPNLEEDIKRGEEESAKGLLYPLEDILDEESE